MRFTIKQFLLFVFLCGSAIAIWFNYYSTRYTPSTAFNELQYSPQDVDGIIDLICQLGYGEGAESITSNLSGMSQGRGEIVHLLTMEGNKTFSPVQFLEKLSQKLQQHFEHRGCECSLTSVQPGNEHLGYTISWSDARNLGSGELLHLRSEVINEGPPVTLAYYFQLRLTETRN